MGNKSRDFKLLFNHGFSPANLFAGGLGGVWYDPSNITSMFQDSAQTTPAAVNSPVGFITDLSGNGNHLLQATAGKRPTLKLISGLYSLEFNGTNSSMATTGNVAFGTASSLGLSTAFQPTNTSTGVLLETGTNSNSVSGSFSIIDNNNAAGKISSQVNTAGSIDAIATTSSSYGNGVTSLISFQAMDITQALAQSKMPMRRNGALEPTTVLFDTGPAGTTYTSLPINLGMRNAASNPTAMEFYGLVIRNTPFSTAEMAHLETWLGAKCGLTL